VILAIESMLHELRTFVAHAWAEDTVSPSSQWLPLCPSTGHCAVTAMLVRELFGGEYVSAIVAGSSHWFNRISVLGIEYDVDITGDQFGLKRVQVALANRLYEGTRVRLAEQLNTETIARFERLVWRVK
jgi:hypothetical protein